MLSPLQLGLIDESEFERKKKKSQWAGRYNERVNESTLVGADLAEGEEGDNYDPAPVMDPEEVARRKKAGLWTRREEEYYNEDGEGETENQRHWHYPANFEGAAATTPGGESSDRWDRTRAARDAPPAVSSSSKPRFGRKPSSKADKRAQILAYAPKGNSNPTSRGDYRSSYADSDPLGADDGDIPEWGRDYGAPKTKGKAQRQRSTTQSSAGSWADRSDRNDYASPNGYSATGTGYGEGRTGNSSGGGGRTVEEENWNHQF
ncbi:hypothetical protein QFC24_003453 [Naganishia onofrii]|uniref:Uncharacterized protein n=1 Tax=Naganishia onofrii TaxID=1851511 RepID=A0ACC2XIB0_9TREE|nr:hypothetical protein QFC24_003453 [Naganishia onofrii]